MAASQPAPARPPREGAERLLIGVSACLMGETVRWDRGHARQRFLTDELAPWADFVRVCPEVEAGFGVPRPTMRLVEVDGATRLEVPATGEDVTEPLLAAVATRLDALAALPLDGFVVKRDSPSCGLERVRVRAPGSDRVLRRDGRGLFTAALLERLPGLPVEEEGRLGDPLLRDNFLERVWCRQRWRLLRRDDETRAGLVRFHTAHKFLIRAHDEERYRELGRVVAGFGSAPDREVFDRYGRLFEAALAVLPTRGRHANVLQHLFGFLKDALAPREKELLLERIDDYRRGVVPLIVPLALLQFEAERREASYAAGQLYFTSAPEELRLRNRL